MMKMSSAPAEPSWAAIAYLAAANLPAAAAAAAAAAMGRQLRLAFARRSPNNNGLPLAPSLSCVTNDTFGPSAAIT